MRRLRLGEEPQMRRLIIAADAVGAHLVGGSRGRRGLLAARWRVAEGRREERGGAVAGRPTVVSGEKSVEGQNQINEPLL